MRQVLPHPIDVVDPAAAYAADARPTPPDRPWVLLDMVASLDGAVSVGGRSGGLSSPGDRAVFHGLRALADAVLVGAGTARAERYGPTRVPPAVVARRVADGRAPQPELVVVSASLSFPADQPFLTAAGAPAVVATVVDADPVRRAELAGRTELLDVGEGSVDPGRLLSALAARGHRVVLCEGGPMLNGALAEHDLVDEVCLSMAPLAVGGAAGRILEGPALDPPHPFALDRVLEEDGVLFLRYLRRSSTA